MNPAEHPGSRWDRFIAKRRSRSAIGVLAFGIGILLAVAPAFGEVSHVYTGSYAAAGSTPANPYPVSGPTDVDVDQASRDFYVTDPGNHRVEKFDSAGNFILMFGKGVDQTHPGDVCTAASGDTCQAGTSSSAPGGFQTPTYLAVDNSNGDIYVADTAASLVSKFDSTGQIVSAWGKAGQKDGSDTELTSFLAAGGITSLAVGGPNGDLYVGTPNYYEGENQSVLRYTPSGVYQGPYLPICGAPWLKVDPAGTLFFVANGRCAPSGTVQGQTSTSYYGITTDYPTKGLALDPSSEELELYQAVGTQETYSGEVIHGPRVDHYSPSCQPLAALCDPADTFGEAQLAGAGPMGVAVDGTSHTVYVADSTSNDVAVFGDARPIVTVGPSNPTETSVTLNAHIDPAGRGAITGCHLEYGFDKSYGTAVSCSPAIPPNYSGTEPTDVTATISGLSPGTRDHYRFVVSNSADATTYTSDHTFITTQPPAIDGLASTDLTATTADLNAQLDPNGLDTTYRFEYGPTTAYGQSAPVPVGSLSASNEDQAIAVHLNNLTPHVVYHYTLVATNADGTTTAPDHTFNFYPPSCPNENVRQQTQTNYLPDCRAYELVSPGDAGGTQLYPGGPNTGYATNPPRFSFTGLWATIPGSGGDPINTLGDLYVATRTDTGWVTRYVGLPANQTGLSGGPIEGLPWVANYGGIDGIQSTVLTNPDMSNFLVWNDEIEHASNAPYVYSANGSLLDRWPTNLGAVPPGVYPPRNGTPEMPAPGGVHSLDCIYICPGDVNASSDLSHFVFATEWNVFAPGGQLSRPGSVYDNDTSAGTVAVISKTPAGSDIPAEPSNFAFNPLRIPAVSSDGSHILVATPCATYNNEYLPCLAAPSILYMRVNDAMTACVSCNAKGEPSEVKYVGMTSDASEVFFTSEEHLTNEDLGHGGASLYMWSEKGELNGKPLTLISKGNNPGKPGEPGNTSACNASFTTECGVVTYSNASFCALLSGQGGNCRSDNSIASQNGDIYFFSPEQLDGSRGIPNKENLYVFHDGGVQYVTTLTTGPFCVNATIVFIDEACSDTPIARMQVSPDGSHMAFLTASPVTQYDNAGHLEMYLYDPATRKVVCASCLPSGAPPSSDVLASQNGLFMANDGRVLFSTNDALVKGDTNNGLDVYEYVDGRPQLITPGTGETQVAVSFLGVENTPGLTGVSADGRDVYFATYNTLVPQDHNGLFLKYYDARADGGFSAPAPPPPCNAADECHGAGSSAPAAPTIESGVNLGSRGNVSPTINRHRHKKNHQRHHARHNRGVGK